MPVVEPSWVYDLLQEGRICSSKELKEFELVSGDFGEGLGRQGLFQG